MSEPSQHEQRFRDYLVSLVREEKRGSLAALRRGLGKPPGSEADMYPYIVPWLPETPNYRLERAFYLGASLFAWHSNDRHDDQAPHSLGASLAWAARGSETEGTERRFVALLNSADEDLPEHLRHAVGLCRAQDVPVDWAQLIRDVQDWSRPSRSVQRNWARGFWGRTEGAGAEEVPSAS